MKAVVCRKLGDPTRPASEGGALRFEETGGDDNLNTWKKKKLPSSGVRVRVAAAALNFADMLMVQGGDPPCVHSPHA